MPAANLSTRLIDKEGVLQSVLFQRQIWSVKDAKVLLRRHGRRTASANKSTTATFLRFRQRAVNRFRRGSLRTVATHFPGVKVIVGERRPKNPKRNRPLGVGEWVNDLLSRKVLA